MAKLKIKIVDLYRSFGPATGFRNNGMKIRQQLESEWDNFDRFKIKMVKLKGASPSFLDEAFAKLFLEYPREEIVRKLKFVGISNYHKVNLNGLIAIRLRQNQKEKEKN